MEVVLLDQRDIPSFPVSASLYRPITGEPNIDSKALVVLGSGGVDSIARATLMAACNDISPALSGAEGVSHPGIWGKLDTLVLATGGRNAARGSSASGGSGTRAPGRSSFLGPPARFPWIEGFIQARE
jgi:hypothetical protein